MENETGLEGGNLENPENAGDEGKPEGEPEGKPEGKPKLSDEEQLAIHRRETTKLEKKLGIFKEKPKEQPKSEPQNKSNEPDYAKLAYLEAKTITHPDDQKIVMDEAERLKLPLTDILAMEHIKGRLEANKDARTAQAGMPKGKTGRSGNTQTDVDYWVQKGETPDDQELAEKVVDARMAKEKSNKFSDELFIG